MFSKWLQFNNLSIRNKLILHFILISILPSLVITLLISWTVSNMLEKQSNTQILQLIGNVSKSLDAQAANIQNISYFISMDPDIQTYLNDGSISIAKDEDRYRLYRFLQSFTTLYSEIAGIMIVRADGQYFSNDMYARSEKNLIEEYWYHEAMAARGIYKMIGHPSERNVTTHVNYKDSEIVSVVRAIQDPDTGTTKGVVLIDLKLRVIAEMLGDVKLGKSGYLIVVDDNNDLIYSPKNGITLDRDAIAQMLEHTSTGSFAIGTKGESLQILYQKSNFTNWTTVGVFPIRDTLQAIKDVNLYLVIFLFVVCMLGITASYYLSFSISRPIAQLASSMRKVEEGNMNIRFSGVREDEVGRLGNSFNKMLTQMKKLLRQVEQEQMKKREAELRSLQAHIQPHFLYNTLDTIQWLARKDGAKEATEMVEALSKLFRLGLSKGQELVPMQDEIEHITSYLVIQKTRYKEKLNYSLDIDDGVTTLYVIKLILQPIVENAIYHGIKERRGSGHIHIRATVSHGFLRITVEDDGAGMDETRLLQLRQVLRSLSDPVAEALPTQELTRNGQSFGYGLRNVQERLLLSFGNLSGISVDSSIGKGTMVTISHPIMKQKGGEASDENVEGYRSG